MKHEIRPRLIDIIESYGYEVTLKEIMWIIHDRLKANPADADYALNSIGEAVRMLQRNE